MRHPDVPESLEGWWILHRMFRFDRERANAQSGKARARAVRDAIEIIEALRRDDGDVSVVQIAGHKADLMFTHYAKSFEGLLAAQSRLDAAPLRDYLSPAASYVSVLELGLYDATAKIHEALASRALKPHSPEWNAAFDELLAEQAANPRNAGRLWARVPDRPFACFYPMNKRRGESVNWYALPFADRARLMLDHGKIGRTFHGQVTQVISGSIGFDDYEWGVDLYADDPLVFKKLIYEMRFDEASAKYAEFGPFYAGMQLSNERFERYLAGE